MWCVFVVVEFVGFDVVDVCIVLVVELFKNMGYVVFVILS